MKSLLPLVVVLMLLVAATVEAQMVIRPDDIPSQPGLVMEFWTAADMVDGIEVDIGQPGEDRRWDLTGLQFDEITADTLLNPAQAPDRQSFPRANRVVASNANDLGLNVGGGAQYQTVADSGWHLLGISGAGPMGQALVFPRPALIMPMPAEYGEEWEISVRFEFGFPAPDTLMDGVLDSIIIRVNIGGFASIDGEGVVAFSGGEVRTLRQRITTGGRVTAVGVRTLFGRRIELELPFGYEIETGHTYRWVAPDVGEIAVITSMPGEQEPNFQFASQVRARRIIPALEFPPEPLDFGVVHLGNSGIAGLVLRNSGEGIGSIARYEFSGGVGGEMEPMFQLPLMVPPDSAARMRFIWTPAVGRSLFGQTLLLFHNDPEVENPLALTLRGATPGFESVSDRPSPPAAFSLIGAHPNPFNGRTRLSFQVGSPGEVRLTVADLSGRVISSNNLGVLTVGGHHTAVDLQGRPAGLYWAEVQSGSSSAIVPLVLLR